MALTKKNQTKTVSVEVDDINSKIAQAFDYEFTGVIETELTNPQWLLERVPPEFGIGLIVGPSGSGKSTLLEAFGQCEQHDWDERSVCSHFGSAEAANDRMAAVGFNSIPSRIKPYHVLSTGEKFRVDLAIGLGDGKVFDEFTSVVDRTVAKTCASSIKKYTDRVGLKGMVFASCHYDIIEWLQPDWVYDTNTKELKLTRGVLRRPSIEIELIPSTWQEWSLFSPHHYLSANVLKSSHCWVAYWEGVPVGFTAVITMPSGTMKKAFRGHRTVVLPDYQGIGIGVRISDAMGAIITSQGGRYFSKTANPVMGEYRENSERWKATSKNRVIRDDYVPNKYRANKDAEMADRDCYSHEYIGGGDWLDIEQPPEKKTRRLF